MHITKPDELAGFIKRAQESSVLAVDTEFIREKTYYPRLCLIQCAIECEGHVECVTIDPLAVHNLTPLKPLFENESIVKIFHACTQDVEILLDELGAIPRPLFDTQIGSAFLGGTLQIGYGALVEQYCKVKLDKSEALTDWSARPLDAAQLSYAVNDVKYLPFIYRKMTEELSQKGRLSWMEDEVAPLYDPAHYRLQPTEAYKKVKRVSSLKKYQLAAAQRLAMWREKTAQKRNIPRRRVLSDELIIEISKRMIRDKRALSKVRGSEHLSDQDFTTVLSLVDEAARLPEDQLPPSLAKRPVPHELESVIDLMNALVRIVAEREQMAAPLLAQRNDLTEFARAEKKTILHTGWRYELIGKDLERLMEGKMALTVQDGRVEISR